MNFRVFILRIALFLFSVFCAVAAQPKWISAPHVEYSPKEFMVAVGHGKTLKDSDLAAVEELAGQFGRDIRSSSVSSSRMKQAQKNGTLENSTDSSISLDVQQKVSMEDLVGIEIREHYQEGKEFYSLAVLEKSKASQIFISTIKKNDMLASRILKDSKTEEFSMEKVGDLSFARDLALMNEKLVERLKVIDFEKAGQVEKGMISSVLVKKQIAEITRIIPVYISIRNDVDGKIGAAFASMVSASGFRISDNPDERYSITGSVEFSRRTTKDNSSFQVNYTLEAALRDSIIDEILLPFSLQGRSSAANAENADVRTIRDITAKIETTCRVSFLNMLNSGRL